MKLYNSTDSQISMPLNGGIKLVVPGHSFSTEFMPNDSFLALVSSVFNKDQIALVVSGPFEINMCAKAPACAPMIAQSQDEALRRFLVEVPEVKEEKVEETKEVKEEKVEEKKEAEVKSEEEPVKEEKKSQDTVTKSDKKTVPNFLKKKNGNSSKK